MVLLAGRGKKNLGEARMLMGRGKGETVYSYSGERRRKRGRIDA